MVVDDEKDLACLFKDYLGKCGFETICFTNPVEAIEHFEQNSHSYSLVLVDLKMLIMDGIRLSKRIRELNDNVKIVLITAHSINDIVHTSDFINARISLFLLKPLKLYELREHIKQILSE